MVWSNEEFKQTKKNNTKIKSLGAVEKNFKSILNETRYTLIIFVN